MFNVSEKNIKYLMAFIVLISLILIGIGTYLSNRYKINNFTADIPISTQDHTINQTLFMYSNRTLRYLHLYTKDNTLINASIKISHGTNTFQSDNLAQYQYKDGSFRVPLNLHVMSTDDLSIQLQGDNLDKILTTDNTLLGKLNNDPTKNLKISMIFLNDVDPEQQIVLWSSAIILLLMYVLIVLFAGEYTCFIAFTMIYTFLTIGRTDAIIPFAEVLSNFGFHAFISDWKTAWLAADYGYLPLIPRAVSLLIVKLFHAGSLYLAWLHIFSLFFTSFCISFFTLKTFRVLISLDRIRLFLVLILGIMTPHGDLLFLFNSSYYAIFVFPVLLVPKKILPKWVYIFSLAVLSSAFLSKILFISIAPIIGTFTLYYWHNFVFKKNLEKKELVFFTILSLAVLSQVAYIFAISHIHEGRYAKEVPLVKMLYYSPLPFIQSFFPILLIKKHIITMSISAILIVVIWGIMFRYTEKKLMFFILCGGFVAIIISALMTSRLYAFWDKNVVDIRHMIIPNTISFFLYAVFLFKLLVKNTQSFIVS